MRKTRCVHPLCSLPRAVLRVIWISDTGARFPPKSLFLCDSLRWTWCPCRTTSLILRCRVFVSGVAAAALPREMPWPVRFRLWEARSGARP
ncbi:hypothetical protein BJY52DRAFT_1178028 [Lactarius psammicola]|nr:hypothetical protein BJY52DRAFT_1178028 [Lactarius psammicola]